MLVVNIFWLHYCCNPPSRKPENEMNKTIRHYHLYLPCRPTDVAQSELCVVFVIYFNKEMLILNFVITPSWEYPSGHLDHGHHNSFTLPPTILPTLQKGHTAVE